MRRVLLLALALSLPSVVLAQDPNLQRGFAPGKVYDMLGLDSINAFNGNLNVRIPLGQKYTVGPVLQYQFLLAYNSKIWEFEYVKPVDGPSDEPRKLPLPDTQSNAGLGWRLTLGELYPPKSEHISMPPTQGWTYVAPDGSSHEFPSVDAQGPSGPIQSQDGSFLRLRRVYEGSTILYEIDFPDGTIHRFRGGQVEKITDRYGNWVKVDRTDPYAWKVRDGYASTTSREHTIVLADGVNVEGEPYNQKNFQKRPVALKLAAFDTTVPATYRFTYDDVALPAGICAGNGIALQDELAPLLKRVELPDGTSYVPSYQMQETERCTSGVLKELTLPTLGRIAWQHGLYEMAFPECIPESPGDTDAGWVGSYAGVRLRVLKDKNGDAIETRIYTPGLVERENASYRCGAYPPTPVILPLPPEELRTTITVVVPEGATQKIIEKTTNYFSAFPKMANPALFTEFAKGIEYGLPFTRSDPQDGRFLSSETYDCSLTSCAGTAGVARASYLQYEYETGSDFSGHLEPINPRVKATRTVFSGDSCKTGCDHHYTDTEHDEYDGYGHFRKTVISGALGGVQRTVRTEYQPDTANWLLNKYRETSVIESGETTQRTAYTFDHAGLLESRRTLKGATPGAGDLLSVTCRDARGFVIAEKFLGGDWDADGPPAGDNLCAATAGSKEYEIVHAYPPGDGFRTWHRARYRDQSFSIADETLDANTGLVSATRDSTGLLTTSYDYDDMGRLTSLTPPGAKSTSFAYREATSADPARVTSTTLGTTTTVEQTYDYDDVGRLFREKRRMPDGSWALRKTDYRGAAATKFTSEWVRLESGANENLVSPTVGTKFEHDQFGRVTKVMTPDQKELATTYVNGGAREVRKTRKVATSLLDESAVTVTEEYDIHGQLVKVGEPAGPTSAGATTGSPVVTEYGYDTGGRLVSVTMTGPDGTQRRNFGYDSRGFLTEETHPEKNLATTYDKFDARGHAWQSTDADVTVEYEYDDAERLTKIRNAGGAVLKEFVFGTPGACTYCKGKLWKAIRHNFLGTLGDHEVTETYTYGANGLPSKRETAIRRGSTEIQKFTQDFSYDEFLALDGVDYPTCSSCSMTGALTSVDHTRTRGLLTRVNGFASISYHPSGMVNEVKRETARVMTDTYEADSGMARPSKITFSGALACTVPSPPEIAVAAFVCGGAAGNQASVSSPQQSGVTYEWTIQNGTLATATGTSVSFTAGSSGQVTLTVTARNDCGTATSIPKTARIPEAIVSGGKTVNAGSPAGISVALTGTPNWRLTWSDNNFVSSGIAVSQFERTVTPNVTTTYQLVAATDGTPCNLVRSGSATITVIPPAPGGIVAEATDRSVEVDWQAVPSIPGAKYEVERASKLNGPWTRVGSVTAQLSLTDTPPADPAGARIAYVYRVRTVAPDGTRSAESASPRDYAVTATSMYPSGAITARATFVKVQHVVELRRGIDALRKLVNLPETFASQPDPAGWVVASHFTALLAPLDQARSAFGHGSFAYGGVPRPAAGVTIKAEHVTQLREVLK